MEINWDLQVKSANKELKGVSKKSRKKRKESTHIRISKEKIKILKLLALDIKIPMSRLLDEALEIYFKHKHII